MFKILTEKMGKDKGSILKAKYIDVKKISAQIEDDLKHKSEKDRLKKKTIHYRRESYEKVEMDIKKKSSKFIDDTKATSHHYLQELERLHSKVRFL